MFFLACSVSMATLPLYLTPYAYTTLDCHVSNRHTIIIISKGISAVISLRIEAISFHFIIITEQTAQQVSSGKGINKYEYSDKLYVAIRDYNCS